MYLAGDFVNPQQNDAVEQHCNFNISHTSSDEISTKSYENDNICIYLHGEVYKSGCDQIDFPSLANKLSIINDFSVKSLGDVFHEIDGYFTLVLVDKKKSELYLVTDRYGLWPLYMYRVDNNIRSWSTLLGRITECDSKLDIDKDAICSFLNHSHFLGNNTLYKNVSRVEPSKIIRINQNGNIINECQYWTWSEIKPRELSFDEAVDELYIHFINAVESHLESGKKYCLTLSGGLDSRALLAAACRIGKYDITCLSFGYPESQDVKIASEVCKALNVTHQVSIIDSGNWYKEREKGVFNTSGMYSFLHMHGLNPIDEIAEISTQVVNGYLGDLVLGGGYLDKKDGRFLSAKELAQKKYGKFSKNIDFNNEFVKFDSSDPFFILHRGVRFTSMGSDIVNDRVVNVKPFMDNKLLEFVYSLDSEYRYNGKLYHSMLLKYFPDVFSTIPWQTTGKVITGADSDGGVEKFWLSIRPKLVSMIRQSRWNARITALYSKVKNTQVFVDYADWVNQPEFRLLVENVINKDSVVMSILGKKAINNILKKAYTDRNVEPLGCLLSLEIYLSRIDLNGDAIDSLDTFS